MGYNMGECPADIYINKTYTGNGKRYPNRVPEDEEETGNSPVDRARAREAVGPTGKRGDMDTDAGSSMKRRREHGVGVALRRPPCAKRVEGPGGKRSRLYSVGTSSDLAAGDTRAIGRSPVRDGEQRVVGTGARAIGRSPVRRSGGRRNGAPTRGMPTVECHHTDRPETAAIAPVRAKAAGTASMDADAGSGMERRREHGVGAALRRLPCAKRVEGPGGKRPCLYLPGTSFDLAAGETRAIGRSPLRRPGGRRDGAPTRGMPTVECHHTDRPETAPVAQVRAKAAGVDAVAVAPVRAKAAGVDPAPVAPVRAKAMRIDPAAVALAESWMRAYGRPIAPAVMECLLSDGGRRLGRNSPLLGEAVRMAALRCADSPVDYIRALYRDWQARKITTEDDLEAYLDGMKVS